MNRSSCKSKYCIFSRSELLVVGDWKFSHGSINRSLIPLLTWGWPTYLVWSCGYCLSSKIHHCLGRSHWCHGLREYVAFSEQKLDIWANVKTKIPNQHPSKWYFLYAHDILGRSLQTIVSRHYWRDRWKWLVLMAEQLKNVPGVKVNKK